MTEYLKMYYYTQLMIALFLLSFLIPVSFAKSSITLGSRDDVPLNEINVDTTVTDMITFYSFMAGYRDYNRYGAQTTRDNIFQAAFGNGHLYSISFYIGHGGSEYLWNGIFYEQQWFITDDRGGHVHDKDIFQHSECGNCRFVFLWSCFQGDTIGEKHWSGTPFGMPYAWLHTTSLSNDGYTRPDNKGRAFAGFKGVAPFLTYDGLGTTDAGYHFLRHFYYAAIYRGYYYSIKTALDYAANAVWGTHFGKCVLYTGYEISGHDGKMVIYGDGNMHISYYEGKGSCPDVNGDYKIDSIDLGIVYSALGSKNFACDLNGDGKVSYHDLGLEFGYYLGWQTRHYKCVPPAIEITATAFGQAINEIRKKYP